MALGRLINTVMDRLFGITGAFLGSQIPAFIQQYTQRLAGHVDELQYQMKTWEKMALSSGKTLPEYMGKFIHNADPDFSQHGVYMQQMIERLNELSQSMQLLRDSTLWMRPFTFLTHVNGEIFSGTATSFVPQVSLTIEGMCYTLFGLGMGFFAYYLLKCLFRGLFARKTEITSA